MRVWVLLVIGWLVSATAAGQQTEDRVDSSGPYRSKMRILDTTRSATPADSLELPARDDGYATAINERAQGYRLARDGDTPAAIAALRRSLASDALAPLAQDQLRRDLIALLDSEDDAQGVATEYEQWRTTSTVPDAVTSMRAARAFATLAQFVAASDAIDTALAHATEPPVAWQQLKVFVLARLQRYDAAAALAATLLDVASSDAQAWRNVIELQRAAGDLRRATATFELAFERGALRTPMDTQTLAKLYLSSGLPDYALVLLSAQLDSGELAPDAAVYRLLVRAALLSGDRTAAIAPSTALATLTDSAQDWLALAQLYSALDQYRPAVTHLRTALGKNPGPARGRALLLLGEAHVALGDTRAARRAFEQASELGGVYREAQAYLANLEDTPTAPAEADAGRDPANEPVAQRSGSTPVAAASIQRKSLPRQRFFFLSETVTAAELAAQLRSMARQVSTAVRRERLSASGPLQWQIDGEMLARGGPFDVRLGVPVRSRVPPRGKFRNQDLAPMICAYRVYDGDPAGLADAWRVFLEEIAASGLTTGRDSRTLILDSSGAPDQIRFELQIELPEP